MKKRFEVIAMIGVIALTFAACSGSSTGSVSGLLDDKNSTSEKTDTYSSSELSTNSISKEKESSLAKLTKDEIHIGVILVTAYQEEGFVYALEEGFQSLEEEGYKVDYAYDVPESEECEAAIKSLIDDGCNVIYACSYGYGEYLANIAEEYPEVYFNHYAGNINAENLATFFPKNFQSEYLCGIIAGMRTKSNEIGYLASYPIPECIRMIDAFALGAQSVNPDVTINVEWTGSWYDPEAETDISKELVNSGCDVIIAYLDSLRASIEADSLGAWNFGYATSGYDKVPNTYLSNPSFDWRSFFKNDIQKIIDGTWTGTNQWLGIKEGLVSLGEIHNAADGTDEKVEAAKQGFIDGTLDIWQGEIKDNEDNIVVKAGETMTDEELLSIDFFVEGINGYAE